jgi:hypothetical protein
MNDDIAVDAATYLDELCRDLIASVYKEGDTSKNVLPAISLVVDEAPGERAETWRCELAGP